MNNLEDRLINILLRDYQVAEKATVDDIKKLIWEYTNWVIGINHGRPFGDSFMMTEGQLQLNKILDGLRQKNDQLKNNL